MRLWKNSKGDLIGDEQVLAYLASHGSISAALDSGDIVLVTGKADAPKPPQTDAQRRGRRNHAKLASYL
jgi:hypothetical protein